MSRVLSMMVHYEGFLAHEEQREEEGTVPEDETLFVQMTPFELVLTKYALEWLQHLYPNSPRIRGFLDKLNELIHAQAFCDCPNCKAERGEE